MLQAATHRLLITRWGRATQGNARVEPKDKALRFVDYFAREIAFLLTNESMIAVANNFLDVTPSSALACKQEPPETPALLERHESLASYPSGSAETRCPGPFECTSQQSVSRKSIPSVSCISMNSPVDKCDASHQWAVPPRPLPPAPSGRRGTAAPRSAAAGGKDARLYLGG